MNRYGLLVLLFAVLILSAPSVFSGDEKTEEQQAVKTFKQYVSDLMAGYKTEKHEKVYVSVRCSVVFPEYAKSSFEPSIDYKVDVRKTESLVSPYVGTVLFKWNERYSDCQDTREKAQAQTDLKHSDSLSYRYTYAFQDGKWVSTEAEVGSVSADNGSFYWESCADERAQLSSMYELDFGCLVSR